MVRHLVVDAPCEGNVLASIIQRHEEGSGKKHLRILPADYVRHDSGRRSRRQTRLLHPLAAGSVLELNDAVGYAFLDELGTDVGAAIQVTDEVVTLKVW